MHSLGWASRTAATRSTSPSRCRTTSSVWLMLTWCVMCCRREKATVEMAKSAAEPYVPKYDLQLKEGQTFKINIKVRCMWSW